MLVSKITNGDFNPAVTIMLIAAGKQPVNVAVPFIIAQIMAGLAAVEIHKRM
jgi:glycerol uptake facilitator-like aquaporin